MSEALLVESKPATLLDLLDRLLDKGVAISGRVLISIADIDLVYLNLKLLLASVETVEREAEKQQKTVGSQESAVRTQGKIPRGGFINPAVIPAQAGIRLERDPRFREDDISKNHPPSTHQSRVTNPSPRASFFSSPSSTSQPHGKLKIDPKKAQKDLAKLLLTIAELLRRLMERQGIKRMDGGSLNAWQIEQLGVGLMALENTMKDLKKSFGLKDKDLNLNLGPLGELM